MCSFLWHGSIIGWKFALGKPLLEGLPAPDAVLALGVKSVVDEGGVALAAIQGLNEKLEADNAALKQENNSRSPQIQYGGLVFISSVFQDDG